MDSLKVQSADDQWNPTFITASSLRLYKLVSLSGLAVYWNSNDTFVDWKKNDPKESLSSFSKVMCDLIPSEKIKPGHHYILEPVDACLKVVLNKEETFNMDVPKIAFDFLFKKIGVSINELQYKDLLIASEYYAISIKNQKYKHLRPQDSNNQKKNYKLWWKYLTNAILLDHRENKKLWDWKFLKQFSSDRKSYIDLWYKKKAKMKFDEKKLEELEKTLKYETIVSFRELGDALFHQQKSLSEKKANEEYSKRSLFGKMFSAKAKMEDSVEINSETIKELYERMNINEEKKSEPKLPEDYVKMKIDFLIESTSLQVKTVSSSNKNSFDPLLDATFDSISFTCNVRENSMSLSGYLKKFTAIDYHTLQGKPFVAIAPVTKNKNQLEFQFHTNPLHHPYKADTKISLDAQSLDIYFSMKLIDKISDFFSSPIPENSIVIDRISNSTAETMQSLQKQAQLQMKYALNSKKKLDVSLRITAPKIYIPQDFNDLKGTTLVVDLGKIQFSSDLKTAQESMKKEGENTKVTLDYFYDKFDLKLSDMKATISNETQIVSKYEEPKILESVNLEISLRILNNPITILPKIKISAQFLSSISSNVSASSATQILGVLKSFSVDKPKNQEKDLREEKRKNLKSFKALETKKEKKRLENQQQQSSTQSYLNSVIDSNEEESSNFLESLKKNNINFDTGEFSDPKNPKQLQFSFKIPNVSLLLYQNNENSIKQMISCEMSGLDLVFEKKLHSMNLETSIAGFHVKDKVQNFGDSFEKIIDSDIGDNNQLINMKYEGVSKESPLFRGIEHNVLFSFNGLGVMLNRETVIYLLNFLDQIKLEPEKSEENQQKKESASKQIESSNKESTKELSLSTQDDSLLLKLHLNIGSVKGSLNGEGVYTLIFGVGSSIAEIEMRNNGTMKIVSTLGKFNVQDALHVGEYSNIAKTNLDNTLLLKYETFVESEEIGATVDIQINSVEVTFLNSFIDGLINYFDEMDEMKKYMSDSAKVIAKSSVERKKSKMKLKVDVINPIVVIPQSSTSKEIMKVDLGKISILIYDKENQNQQVNAIDVDIKEMNISLSNIEENSPIFYLIEKTSMKVGIERLIDVSVHTIPGMKINGAIEQLKLNVSDFTVGMINGILQGNLCEKAKKNEKYVKRIKKLEENKPPILEEQKEELKIEKKVESDSTWEVMSIKFSFQQLTLSLSEGGDISTAASNFALLEINDMSFLMKNKSDQSMDIDLFLREIIFSDTGTKNSKFTTLFSPILNEKESQLISVSLKKEPSGNQNIFITLEDMRIYLIPEPIWKLNTWTLPLLNKFLAALDSFLNKDSKAESKPQLLEEKKQQVENDNLLSLQLTVKRPEMLLIDNIYNEKSKAVKLDCQIVFGFQTSKKSGMLINIDMSKLTLLKFFLGEEVSDYHTMIEPWDFSFSFSDLDNFRKINLETQNLTTRLTYQDYKLLMKTQEKWLSVIAGNPQENETSKENQPPQTKKIENNNDDEEEEDIVIESNQDDQQNIGSNDDEEQKIDNIYDDEQKVVQKVEKKEEEKKESIMLITARTGRFNVTIIDDIHGQNEPIISLLIDYVKAELTMKSKIKMKSFLFPFFLKKIKNRSR